jgi:hypothetical protein
MKARSFRPELLECEDRLTPAASPAQILADLSIVQMDSAILRSVYEDPAQVIAKGNEQFGQAYMTAIANQSATAVADLTPFVAELQNQIAANPALSGLLGPYVGQVRAAIVTADLNTGYTQFFQQVIGAALEQHQALANAIAASSSTSSSTTPTSIGNTNTTGSPQTTTNPNGTITVNGANGPITLPNPTTSGTNTGTTTGPSTGSTGTTPTSENTSGTGGPTTATPPTTSTGTTQTGATSSVSSATGSTSASGTGGNTTAG